MNPAPPPEHTHVCIRRARKEDGEAVSVLLGQLGYPTTAEDARERVERFLADAGSELLVACAGPQVLGLASMCRVPYFPDGSDVLRVTALVVAAPARRRGVASALLQRAVEAARRRGCSGVEVTTAEHRSDAHAFYEKTGFRRTAYRYFRPVGAS